MFKQFAGNEALILCYKSEDPLKNWKIVRGYYPVLDLPRHTVKGPKKSSMSIFWIKNVCQRKKNKRICMFCWFWIPYNKSLRRNSLPPIFFLPNISSYFLLSETRIRTGNVSSSRYLINQPHLLPWYKNLHRKKTVHAK